MLYCTCHLRISGDPSPRSWHINLERELDHVFVFSYITFLFLREKPNVMS